MDRMIRKQVYTYDRSQPEEQAQALALLDRLVQQDAGVLSAQALADQLSRNPSAALWRRG